MLSGFPTSLFINDSDKPTIIIPSKGYVLKHASPDAYQKLLQAFADVGSATMILRSWVKRLQSIPLIQVFQSSVSDRLDDLDTLLSAVQLRFVAIVGRCGC